jgi:hypothetical protein
VPLSGRFGGGRGSVDIIDRQVTKMSKRTSKQHSRSSSNLSKWREPAIIVAIIGVIATIVAGLFSFPPFTSLFDNSSTPTVPTAHLIIENTPTLLPTPAETTHQTASSSTPIPDLNVVFAMDLPSSEGSFLSSTTTNQYRMRAISLLSLIKFRTTTSRLGLVSLPDSEIVVRLKYSDTDLIRSWLDDYPSNVNGKNDIYDGLFFAYKMLVDEGQKNTPKSIIIFSDGKRETLPSQLDLIVDFINKEAIRIVCIVSPDYDRKVMSRICDVTWDISYTPNDEVFLESLYK